MEDTLGVVSPDCILHLAHVLESHREKWIEENVLRHVSFSGNVENIGSVGSGCDISPRKNANLHLDNLLTVPPHLTAFLNTCNEPGVLTSAQCAGDVSSSVVQQGIYEGGAQLWECTFDLLRYIYENIADTAICVRPSISVLELGCGQGLPGIACLLYRRSDASLLAKTLIVFQDLNINVLYQSTIPNCFLTLRQFFSFTETVDILVSRCRFVFGSWENLVKQHGREPLLLPTETGCSGVDFILSSESLYRLEAFPALGDLIRHHLAKQRTSMAIFATKRFYFGIGGGTYPFIEFIRTGRVTSSADVARKNEANMGPTVASVEHQLFGTPACPTDSSVSPGSDTETILQPTSESHCVSLEDRGPDTSLPVAVAASDSTVTVSNLLRTAISCTIQDGRSNIRDIIVVTWTL